MKKTLLLIITIILVQLNQQIVQAQSTYTWEYVNTLQNEWLQKIYTQGLDTVYIVGRNGLIAKSTDRTATWTKQYPVTSQLNDIIFCNHTTGFAVGNNGTILRTTDAGANWTKQTSGITANLNAIAATGTDNIWAVGDSGKVVYSTNAGNSWTTKNISTTSGLNDVSFQNGSGYIIGTNKFSIKTIDPGNTWTENPISLSGSIPSLNNNLISIIQTPNHVYMLLGSTYMGHYIKRDNNYFPLVPSNYYSSFNMLNDSIGFCIFTNTTSNGERIINVSKMKNGAYLEEVSLSPTIGGQLDNTHSDIRLINDTIGYFISGNLLFHSKKSIETVRDGLNNTSSNKLSIENNTNELCIRFGENKIRQIELYNITGLKVLSENVSSSITSKRINTVTLPIGVYIIRACNNDNTYTNIKWIKQ